ncbi:MAG: potassium channel family protein [Actinomycetota bacterium]
MTPDGNLVRRLGPPLLAIVLVYIYGVGGYLLFGFGFVDALYMTALALTTVGFIPTHPFGTGEKLLTISISVLGVSTFLAFLSLLAVAIAEGRFSTSARRRRMERRIRELEDHFIVCAYGRVGRTVCRELEEEGRSFVVIDIDENLEELMIEDGVVYIIGDPSASAILKKAGIENARALVCAVDNDAQAVYITLTARSLNSSIFIVARASESQSEPQLERAGADRVISPYVTSGRHMAVLAMRPRLLDYLDIRSGEGSIRLDELAVQEGSPLVGRPLKEVGDDAVPLVVRRSSGELVRNPSPDQKLEAGDLVILLGEPMALRPVEED